MRPPASRPTAWTGRPSRSRCGSPAASRPAWFEVASKDGAWYARRVDDQAVLKLDAAKAEALIKQFKEL